MRPPLTAIGSHMMAATWPGCSARIASTETGSFHWAMTTSERAPSGIPAVEGTDAGCSDQPDRIGS